MVPEIKVRQTGIFDILGHFLPFQPLDNLENQNFNIEINTWRYYHFTHLHHKWQSYDAWFLRYGADRHNFLSFWTVFCHFTPLWPQKIKFFKKMEKNTCRHHNFTNINDSHMMCGSSDMECNRQNFCVILDCFCF